MSKVFLALSLTKERAMGGILEDASPAILPSPIKYGTDILKPE